MVVVGLLALARHHGVNLSALGIGVDFLQVVSMYASPLLSTLHGGA